MQIQSIQQNSYQPKFKSWQKSVFQTINGCEVLKYRTTTECYRDNVWWEEFFDFITKFFSDVNFVNVRDYGCSNGAEPTTFIIHLFANFPELADKFAHVIAKDIDKEAIQKAKSQKLNLNFMEVHYINKYTRGKFKDFFSNVPKCYELLLKNTTDDFQSLNYEVLDFLQSSHFLAKLKENYHKCIDYSIGDILTEYKNFEPENNILFMKNFLPYIQRKSDVYKLIRGLSEKFQKKSCIAIGTFDRASLPTLETHIKNSGFKNSGIEGVFYKE